VKTEWHLPHGIGPAIVQPRNDAIIEACYAS
jgi:hypothetical protein